MTSLGEAPKLRRVTVGRQPTVAECMANQARIDEQVERDRAIADEPRPCASGVGVRPAQGPDAEYDPDLRDELGESNPWVVNERERGRQ